MIEALGPLAIDACLKISGHDIEWGDSYDKNSTSGFFTTMLIMVLVGASAISGTLWGVFVSFCIFIFFMVCFTSIFYLTRKRTKGKSDDLLDD